MNTADWQEGHTHTCVCMYVLTPNHILSLHTIISSTKHFDKRNWQQGARMYVYLCNVHNQPGPSTSIRCSTMQCFLSSFNPRRARTRTRAPALTLHNGTETGRNSKKPKGLNLNAKVRDETTSPKK